MWLVFTQSVWCVCCQYHSVHKLIEHTKMFRICLVVVFASVVAATSTKEEIDCFKRGEFYHEPTRKCYGLLNQGPCAKGEWFVLRKPLPTDTENIVKAVCEKDLCRESQFNWPGRGCISFKEGNKTCKEADSKSFIDNNEFGEGECSCLKTPVHGRLNDDEKNKCYELYKKGPCRRREILAVPEDSAVPKCIPDPCFQVSFDLKKSNKISNNATLVMYNGACHELETRGPCKDSLVLRVSLWERRVNCVGLTQTIFDLEKETDCLKDENGHCLQIVHLNHENSYRKTIVAQLMAYQERHRKMIQIVVEDEIE